MANVATTPTKAVGIIFRVIFALILRETKTRYGRYKLGYIWAFLEPVLFISILSFIFSIRRSVPFDVPTVLFCATGVIPFFLFRNIVTQTMTAIRANIQLLVFPQVQVSDLGFARTVLDFATYIVVFALLMAGIDFLQIAPVSIQNPIQLFQAAFLIVLTGYGFGTSVCSLALLFPAIEVLIATLILRPLFFVSGVFFSVDMLPPDLRAIALFNPILQLIELFRSAFFANFDSQYVDMSYLVGFSLTQVFLGLLLQRAFRKHAFIR